MNSEFKRFLSRNGYILGEKIGEGSFGTVFRCSKLSPSGKLQSYAVKVVDLRKLMMESKSSATTKLKRLNREIDIMQKLDFPAIVKLHEVFRTREAFFLIMDIVIGVDLFDIIIYEKGLKNKEPLAAEIFSQVAEAVSYMHGKSILHRDLKPENIIVQSDSNNSEGGVQVRLIDFGLSKMVNDSDIVDEPQDERESTQDLGLSHTAAKSLVGTPKYIAPEILTKVTTSEGVRESYGKQVDLYSMGVLLHVMLGACYPDFSNPQKLPPKQDYDGLMDNLPSLRSTVLFEDARISDISVEAKDLLRKLLEPDPDQRISIAKVLQHPWITKFCKPKNEADELSMHLERSLSIQNPPASKPLPGPSPLGMKPNCMSNQNLGRLNAAEANSQPFRSKFFTPDRVSLKRPNSISAEMQSDEIMMDKAGTEDSIGSAEVLSSPFSSSRLNSTNTEDMAVEAPAQSQFTENHQTYSSGNPLEVKELKEAGWDIVRRIEQNHAVTSQTKALEDPDRLFDLQAQIATCLKAAYNQFLTDEKISPMVVNSAVGSRELMRATQTILRKLEQTSFSVLGLLPDLKLAVDEGEFMLAKEFFGNVKSWINTLRDESTVLLEKNQQVITMVSSAISLIRAKEQNIGRKPVGVQGLIGPQVRPSGNGSVKQLNDVEVESIQSVPEGASFNEDSEITDVSAQGDNNISVKQLQDAILLMQQVDAMLQQHASFWSHMEVVIQVLVQRADHVEGITHFTRNPKLRGRFLQRLQEYGRTWETMKSMCQRFNARAGSLTPVMYSFLTDAS
eukprot:snap_masked-scaffold_9-processed-gene-3.28-mRNA-1 protein AED:0.13 eAED:0.19 QI:0/-1/0/1/-1/1/1/0/787